MKTGFLIPSTPWLLSGSLAIATISTSGEEPGKRPKILMIVVDDMNGLKQLMNPPGTFPITIGLNISISG
jgi:hypothetical protein